MNPSEGRRDLDNSYRTFLTHNKMFELSRKQKRTGKKKRGHRKRPEYKEYESDSWLVSRVDEEEDQGTPSWLMSTGVREEQQVRMKKKSSLKKMKKKTKTGSEKKSSMKPISSSSMIKNADRYSKKYLLKHLSKDYAQTPTVKRKLFREIGSPKLSQKRHYHVSAVQAHPESQVKNIPRDMASGSTELKKPRREMQTSLDSFSLCRPSAPASSGTAKAINSSRAESQGRNSSMTDTSQSSEGGQMEWQTNSSIRVTPLHADSDICNISSSSLNGSSLSNSTNTSHPSIVPVQIRLYDWARNKLLKGLPVVAKEPTSSQRYDVELKDGAIVSKGGQIMVRGVRLARKLLNQLVPRFSFPISSHHPLSCSSPSLTLFPPLLRQFFSSLIFTPSASSHPLLYQYGC
eukprot:307128-Hanusia_phi.AAC.3